MRNRALLPCLLLYPMLGAAAPSITGAFPNPIDAGGPYFLVTIAGMGFLPEAAVAASGVGLTTTFVNATKLEAAIPASLRASSGTLSLMVFNPDHTVSNPYPLTVSPVIGAVYPATVLAGGPAVTITVTGLGLGASCALVLRLQGQAITLATTLLNSATLTGTVPAGALATPQAATVQILDLVSGGVSALTPFRIQAFPVITSVSANPIDVGGPPFQMTLFGSGFMPNIAVNWAGTPIGTTYVSPNQIQAAITEGLRRLSGTFALTVTDPGVATSAAFPIVVSPLLVSIIPASAPVGSTEVTITASGQGFTPNNALLFAVSGQQFALATTFVNAQTLRAAIPAAALAAGANATVQVVDSGGGRSLALPFTVFTTTPSAPATTGPGIVNATSPLASIAPGSLISIYGANFASRPTSVTTFPLPGSVDGTSVAINGILAPLLYVSPGQINAQVPYEIEAGKATLVIESGAVKSTPVTFPVSDTGPGVFTTASGHTIAQNFPDLSANSPLAPAKPGQYLVVYLTGQGLVKPPVETGAASPADVLAVPVAPVVARIGGVEAFVSFVGLAPGFAGLLQMNLIIPEVASGEQPLEVTIGGVTANPTFVSVNTEAMAGSDQHIRHGQPQSGQPQSGQRGESSGPFLAERDPTRLGLGAAIQAASGNFLPC